MNLDNELQILSLRIKNYRQYYGDQKIILSSINNNINIIQGENGEGKSNILNAISYCLYLKEPHLKPVSPLLPIINLRTIHETKVGDPITMEIELELGNESVKYRILRQIIATRAKLQRHGNAENSYAVEKVANLGTFPINFAPREYARFITGQKNGSGYGESDVESSIRHLLPEELRSFYFLDGEFLESLHVMFDKIKDGIEDVSHLTLVFSTIEHLKKILRVLEQQTKGMDSDVDNYQERFNRAKDWLESTDNAGNFRRSDNTNDVIWKPYQQNDTPEYHPVTGRPRLESKQQEAERFIDKIEEIDQKLQIQNAELFDERFTELTNLEKNLIPQKEAKLNEIIKERMENIVSIGPEIYLDSCIQYLINLVDEKRSKGELPVKWTDIFINDLLHKNRCICGNDLSSEIPRKTLSEWYTKSKLSEKLDVAIEANADFKASRSTLQPRIAKLDKLRVEISMIRDELRQHYRRRKLLEQTLKNTDKIQIQNLMNEKAARSNLLHQLNQEIGELKNNIRYWEHDYSEAENQLRRAEKKNIRLTRERAKVYLCRRTVENLEKVRDTVLASMRAKVITATKDNFLNLIWKKDEFSDVMLSNDYKLAVIKNGFNAVHTLSAGEKLVLALSFIAAIRNITGFKMPLIIDTPLAKISGEPTKNIGHFLGKFAHDTQVTLLVTDKEYQFVDPKLEQSFRDIIKSFVNEEYLLYRDPQKGITTVVEMK